MLQYKGLTLNGSNRIKPRVIGNIPLNTKQTTNTYYMYFIYDKITLI